ncbi:hypothetical protein GC176_15295 [bacterium]|nr:hypothetical protein [bacterium]
MSDATDPSNHQRQIPRKVIGAAILLGLLTPVAYVWYLTPPDVIAEFVHLSRDDSGVLVADDDGSTANRARLKAHLGKLNARNNTSMVSSEVHSNPAFLAASRLAIFNLSDHLLIARVATSLLDQLKQDSPFSEIDYFPPGEQTAVGKLAPDLYLTLDLKSIDESGLIGRDLKALVTARFGTTLAASNFSSHDNQSPPIVSIHADIEVDHESSLTGVESSAAKYTLQGDDIAKQISKHILDKLKKLREQHEPLPDLPVALYPDWTPEPDFVFLDRLQAIRLSGVHGLMFRNESLWEYEPAGDPIDTVASIRDELLAAGWTEHNFYAKAAEHVSLHMAKGDATINVFPERQAGLTHHRHAVTADGAPADEPAPLKHFVRYRDRLPLTEIRAVVDNLFAAERPDINLLLGLRSNWQGDQHSQAVRLIEEQGVRSADAWLLVAEHYSKRKDIEGTRRALACCRFLTQTMTSSGNIDQSIRKIAKELKIDEKQLDTPEQELLRTLGFIALDPESSPSGIATVRFGEPAAFYIVDDDDKTTVFTWTIDRISAGRRFRLVSLEATGGTRSWTTQETSSLTQVPSREHKGTRINAHVEQKTPESLEFTVTLTQSPAQHHTREGQVIGGPPSL